MAIYIFFWFASLSFGLFIERRLTTNIFLFAVFLFVGLRLETGFDWPVYKEIYATFQQDFSLLNVAVYVLKYGQEPGFLFLLGLSSQYLPNFEVFQALVTIALLWSTVFLAQAVGVRKTALVVAIAMTYLMLPVGFSTLRQSMAISFVNFGLAHFLRRKNARGALFFVLAALFQLSSLVYIAAFGAARFLGRTKQPPPLRTFLIATAGAAVLAPVAIQAISLVSRFAALKLEFYLEFSGTLQLSQLDLIFFVFFGACAVLSARVMVIPGTESPYSNELRQLIMVLSAFGASSNFLTVLRDRVSNELFLLVSILLIMPGVRFRWFFVGFFITFGLFNSVIDFFPYPRYLAFAPYQNVVVSYLLGQESTGHDRSGNFMEILDEMNADLR